MRRCWTVRNAARKPRKGRNDIQGARLFPAALELHECRGHWSEGLLIVPMAGSSISSCPGFPFTSICLAIAARPHDTNAIGCAEGGSIPEAPGEIEPW